MFQATALSLATLLSPPSDVAPPFEAQFDAVDVTVSDTDAVIDALDQSGEVIGSLALWVDDSGTTWIVADFVDGHHALFAIAAEGIVIRQETSDPNLVAERFELLQAHIPDIPEKKSWGECAWKTAVAATGCALARPFACVGGSIKAACACVPMIVKEDPVIECPWGL